LTQINVAVLGFGNVGRSFARYVDRAEAIQGRRLRICAVADVSGGAVLRSPDDLSALLASGRNVAHHFGADEVVDTATFVQMLPASDISTLVEAMPTNICDGQPALSLLRAAITDRIHVVAVDKGPIVHGWAELTEQAKRHGVRLAFTGASGVRAPAGIVPGDVLQIQGVLNGTTNFVLTKMQEEGLSFDTALGQAQEMGVAEPDPSLDIEGWDTSCKILILANAWMRASLTLADVYRTGIGPETETLIEDAKSIEGRVRLVGHARLYHGRARVSVAPKIVDPDSPFYGVSGTRKTALFTIKDREDVVVHSDSGRDSIARIIAEDVIYAATGEYPEPGAL
jgi:homoserine dehydrogenase